MIAYSKFILSSCVWGCAFANVCFCFDAVECAVVRMGVGPITESDVELAKSFDGACGCARVCVCVCACVRVCACASVCCRLKGQGGNQVVAFLMGL